MYFELIFYCVKEKKRLIKDFISICFSSQKHGISIIKKIFANKNCFLLTAFYSELHITSKFSTAATTNLNNQHLNTN